MCNFSYGYKSVCTELYRGYRKKKLQFKNKRTNKSINKYAKMQINISQRNYTNVQ